MTFFYLLSILFIWCEFYYLKNSSILDMRYRDKDIIGTSKLDTLYYISVVINWIWILVGTFLITDKLILSILLIKVLKIPVFHFLKNDYNNYNKLTSVLSLLIMLFILSSFIF
jgi:hypothetical protein